MQYVLWEQRLGRQRLLVDYSADYPLLLLRRLEQQQLRQQQLRLRLRQQWLRQQSKQRLRRRLRLLLSATHQTGRGSVLSRPHFIPDGSEGEGLLLGNEQVHAAVVGLGGHLLLKNGLTA